jgi:hypothetical protein
MADFAGEFLVYHWEWAPDDVIDGDAVYLRSGSAIAMRGRYDVSPYKQWEYEFREADPDEDLGEWPHQQRRAHWSLLTNSDVSQIVFGRNVQQLVEFLFRDSTLRQAA